MRRPLPPAPSPLAGRCSLLPAVPAAARDAAPEPVDPAQHRLPARPGASPPASPTCRPATRTRSPSTASPATASRRARQTARTTGAAPVTRAQMALFLDRVTAYALQASGSAAQRDATDRGFDDLGGQPPRGPRRGQPARARGGRATAATRTATAARRTGPLEPVSRGQMAALLRRTLGSIETLLTGRAERRADDRRRLLRPTTGAASSRPTSTRSPTSASPPASRDGASRPSASGHPPADGAVPRPAARGRGGRPASSRAGTTRAAARSTRSRPCGAQAGAPDEVARGLRVPWGLAPLPTAGRWSASATARCSSGSLRGRHGHVARPGARRRAGRRGRAAWARAVADLRPTTGSSTPT